MKTMLAAALGLALAWSPGKTVDAGTKVKNPLTERADDGERSAVVRATGTVEPEEVIDVGAQVAGRVLRFGGDTARKSGVIDFGSVVKAGTVLAQLDPAPYQAAVAKAKADLQRANATLGLAEVRIALAERELERTRKRAADKADVAVGEMLLAVARANARVEVAGVAQAQAALKEAERTLDSTTIRAPCEGVILDRRVNVGQVVTASLTASSLFLIAKDLKRMAVWVSVKEADIGRLAKGQPATFTVAAFPKETFKGRVAQIRLNAVMVQNVVTYTVVLETDNRNGRLLPYLTADVRIAVGAPKAQER